MLGVVYHAYIINNWKEIVSEQLSRLKKSGLYDAADLIWVTVNLNGHQKEEFEELVKKYNKLKFEFCTENDYEYPAIKKVRELGFLHPNLKIFYFHTKGVYNKKNYFSDGYENNKKNFSNEKVNNIKAWRECLEYFLIDNWKECVKKLDQYDNVGVTCNEGWFWGNFWWSQTKHILKTKEVEYGNRWYFENWLNDCEKSSIKNFEFYKFNYDPYATHIEEEWYKTPQKNFKITIQKAEYGILDFVKDEGYQHQNDILGKRVDVTQIIDNFLKKENYKKFDIFVSNENLGCDPVFGYKKYLLIWFSLDDKTEKIYKIGIEEGRHLFLSF